MNNKIILALVLFAIALLSNRVEAQQSGQKYYSDTVQTLISKVNLGKRTPARIKIDSTINLIYKEIVQELPAEKNAVIKIINTTCNLDIRPWPEAKVKMITSVAIPEKDAATITQEEIMNQAGIIFKSFGNRVDLQTRTSFSSGERTGTLYRSVGAVDQVASAYHSIDVTETIFPNSSQQSVRWMTTGSTSRSVILYIPEGSRLDVNNKNTGIVINADINDARFELSRSSLDARNFKKLFITAEYYSINISDVQEAELELENGNFTGGFIRSLDLDSKNSEIDYESGEQLYVRSQSDRVSVDEITKVGGRKLYGDLRIGKLLGELDIEGTNADIKIRSIASIVEKVKVKDQYANLRLPVKNIPNFQLSFNGDNSTVFASFEKTIIPDTVLLKKDPAVNTKTTTRARKDHSNNTAQQLEGISSTGEKVMLTAMPTSGNKLLDNFPDSRAPSRFKASGGDSSGKHTKFEIICNNCTVDFK